MSSLPQDVRFAFRQIRKSRGFAAIAAPTRLHLERRGRQFPGFLQQRRAFDRMGAVTMAEFNVSTRGVAGRLTGRREWGPVTFAGVALILVAAGALATFIPARRAAAVDPVGALR